MIKYSVTKNQTHQIWGKPKNLDVKIVDKPIWFITAWTNWVNGTFYWYDKSGKTFPTSILIIDGEIIRNEANHLWDYGCPQSVMVVYKDDSVSMQTVKYAHELDGLKDIRLAIGGVGLINTLDPTFTYNPAKEGFKGKFADVLAKRNKTVLAYNKEEDMIYLMVRPSIFHKGRWFWEYDLLKLCRDCGYTFAISLDGGGSTCMDALWRYVFQGEKMRRINNIIGFFRS